MPDRIVLLGAEKQAGTSAALAYPERQFRFVSDQPVLDGWDLPNVVHNFGIPNKVHIQPGETAIELCPRWMHPVAQRPLSQALPRLGDVLPVLPVAAAPIPGQSCIVKGDRFHRPDGTIIGTDLDPADVGDPSGCGTLYQPYWPAEQNILVVGRYWAGSCQLAAIRIHAESCARDDIIAAGETIDLESGNLLRMSLAAVSLVDPNDFFTMNWLRRGTEYRLTSFRPAMRAVFGTLRKAGIDLLTPPSDGLQVAPPGHKFVVDLTYTSYRRLVA